MQWKVYYRGTQGALSETTVEAKDRASLFEELSRRGISAVKIEEIGERRARGSFARRAKAQRGESSSGRVLFWCALGALGVLVVGAFAALALLPGGFFAGSEAPGVPGLIAEVSSSGAKSTHASDGSAAAIGAGDNDADDDPATAEGTAHARAAVGTASALDDEQAEAQAEERKAKRRRIFNSGTDELIALATCAPEGGSIPPLPMIDKHDTDRFIESLSEPIEIDEEDTPEIRAVKERVQKVRMEIVQVFRDNPDMELNQILNEHRDIFNHNSRLYAEAKQEYDELLREGDIEGAREYREGLNEAFAEMGVKQIENEETDDDEEEPYED